MDLRGEQREKGDYEEGSGAREFWRCTLIESETEAAIEAFTQQGRLPYFRLAGKGLAARGERDGKRSNG